jgi:hypothetical protein
MLHQRKFRTTERSGALKPHQTVFEATSFTRPAVPVRPIS